MLWVLATLYALTLDLLPITLDLLPIRLHAYKAPTPTGSTYLHTCNKSDKPKYPRTLNTLHNLLPTTSCLQPTSYNLPPTTCLLQLTSYNLLPTTYFLLSTSYILLPTSLHAYPTYTTSMQFCGAVALCHA